METKKLEKLDTRELEKAAKEKKTMMERINEDNWLAGLPKIPRIIVGVWKFKFKELFFTLFLVFFFLWLLMNFRYEGEKVKIQPNIKVEVNK